MGSRSFDEQLVEDAKRDILSNYYSSCVRDLPPRVADFIESELITEKGFRDSYAREDAVPSHLTDDELTRLIGSRLLRLEEHYGAQRIELTHDVLTGVVREHRDRRRAEEEKAALAARAEQERQALEQAAAQREAELEAEKQRQQAELRDAELRAAQDRERAAQEQQATAEAHAAALRRRSRILRAVLAVTAVIAVVAVILGLQAINARATAQTNLRAATVQKLIAQAQGMLAGTIPGGDARAFQQILAARTAGHRQRRPTAPSTPRWSNGPAPSRSSPATPAR